MKGVLVLCLSLAFAFIDSIASDSIVVSTRTVTSRSPLTVRAEYGVAHNSVSFTRLPGIESCCTDFVGAQGMSALFGASLRIAEIIPSLSIWATGSGAIIASPMSTIANEIVDYQGDAYDATIRHDLSLRYWLAQFSLDANVALAEWLSVSCGIGAALPASIGYDISETIVSPDQLVFETGGVTRNQRSGTSPSSQVSVFVPVRIVGPSVKLGLELTVQPVISFQQSVTSLNSSVDWGSTTFRAGVEVSLTSEVLIRDTQVVREPIIVPPDQIVSRSENEHQQVSIVAGARDSTGDDYIRDVRMTFNVKRRRLAVLPAVFFDSASAEIPQRFKQMIELVANGEKDQITDLDVSHSILHVIGKSMQSQPSSTLILSASHAEDVPEEMRTDLARQRADAVRQYLHDLYQIDSNRYRVVYGAYPERSSSINTGTGRAENRRVDFELKNGVYELPVQPDTIAVESPNLIEGIVVVSRPSTIRGMTVELVADGKVIAKEVIEEVADRVKVSFELTEMHKRKIVQSRAVDVVVNAQDSIDGEVMQRARALNLTVEQDKDKPFDEFGIVLFDYNSSRIAATEKRNIEELKKRIPLADRIELTGTADNSGSEIVNMRLANQRAESVVKALGLKAGSYRLESKIATNYSSALPEGRMLSRQVKIVLQTGNK